MNGFGALGFIGTSARAAGVPASTSAPGVPQSAIPARPAAELIAEQIRTQLVSHRALPVELRPDGLLCPVHGTTDPIEPEFDASKIDPADVAWDTPETDEN